MPQALVESEFRSPDGPVSVPPAKRLALAHHWFVMPRGGERVLAQLARMFPVAPILTSCAKADLSGWPEEMQALGPRIRTTFLQPLYRLAETRPALMPLILLLMPLAFRLSFRKACDDVELLLVSDAGLAKSIPPPRAGKTFVYLHSPMRFVWHEAERHLSRLPAWWRPPARLAASWIRRQDLKSVRHVDHWAANSRTTAARAAAAYGLAESQFRIIHPPVPLPAFRESTAQRQGLLVVSGMEPYKRDDLAIAAATRLGLPLTVVGDGRCRGELERLAGPTVEFLGFVSDADLDRLYRRKAALIFCPEEDFGIVPVEAMARGCPVLAYGAGGAGETVSEEVGGLFFAEQTVEAVAEGIRRMLDRRWDEAALYESVQRFAPERFDAEIRQWIELGLDVGHARDTGP
ncbi:MAG: glycosyltransferase [Pirellulales bacterium]|nr:glycosyltransferase [Pirellulales bacterium]